MGFYDRQVMPRLLSLGCGMKVNHPYRKRVCARLTGEVVEIGFGAGHNVAFYPAGVTSVAAVEPSDVAWGLAAGRVAASPVPVTRAGVDGASLPFEDDSFDAALSTWTLCTIPDVAGALAELRRVLRPGGSLHFLEHGLAPDPEVVRWQRRLEPLQKRMVGGCHLTREIVPLLEAAGFTVDEADVFYERGAPRALAADTLGSALV